MAYQDDYYDLQREFEQYKRDVHVVVSVLLKRMGGRVELTHEELADASINLSWIMRFSDVPRAVETLEVH